MCVIASNHILSKTPQFERESVYFLSTSNHNPRIYSIFSPSFYQVLFLFQYYTSLKNLEKFDPNVQHQAEKEEHSTLTLSLSTLSRSSLGTQTSTTIVLLYYSISQVTLPSPSSPVLLVQIPQSFVFTSSPLDNSLAAATDGVLPKPRTPLVFTPCPRQFF